MGKGKADGFLRNTRAYLSGPMDFVASRAEEKRSGWRVRVGEFLRSLGAFDLSEDADDPLPALLPGAAFLIFRRTRLTCSCVGFSCSPASCFLSLRYRRVQRRDLAVFLDIVLYQTFLFFLMILSLVPSYLDTAHPQVCPLVEDPE